jgi:hypothetical protein
MAADVETPPCNPDAPVCNLSGPMPQDADVFSVFLAPNGVRVVYRADQERDQVAELYSVPVTGGTRRKLNVPAATSGGVSSVAISPDSTRVLYQFLAGTGEPAALYSVPIGGPASASVKLAEDVAELIDPAPAHPGLQISASSRIVVYLTPDRRQLRAVPIDGPASASIRLTQPFAPGDRASNFEISPNNQWVFYTAEQDSATTQALYRVRLRPPDPSNPTTRLSPADVQVIRFLLSPTDRAVVYQGESQAEGPGLYRVPFSGSVSRKISHDLPPDWRIVRNQWTVTPNGARVVYQISKELLGGDTITEMYSAPTTGRRRKVRLDKPPGQPTQFFAVSADGARVVYWLPLGLFSVPIDGPASARVQLDLQPSGTVVSTTCTAYRSTQSAGDQGQRQRSTAAILAGCS